MNSSNLLNFEFYLLFSLELLTFCQKGTQQFICFLALLILCDNVRLVNSQCTLELIDVFHTDRLLIFTSFSHSKRLIVFIENPMNKIANFHFFFCMLTIPVSQSLIVVNTMYLHSSFIEKTQNIKKGVYISFFFFTFFVEILQLRAKFQTAMVVLEIYLNHKFQ